MISLLSRNQNWRRRDNLSRKEHEFLFFNPIEEEEKDSHKNKVFNKKKENYQALCFYHFFQDPEKIIFKRDKYD